MRTWAAQVRTLRHHLESRLKVKVPRTSALMTWLVAWTADVINRYKIRSSGRISYEHITGHRGLQAITAFGEKVMFKYITERTGRNKMETDWDIGYFIGINSRTTEYLIAKGSGVFSTTTIRRHQDDKAYDPEIVKEVTILHRDYVMHGAKSTPTDVRPHTAAPSIPNQAVAPMMPRRIRLRQEDFVEYAYTVGCPGCKSIQLESNVRRGHNEECRARMEEE